MDHVIRNKSNEISSRRSPTPVKDMKSSTKNDHSNIREWDILKSQKEKQDEYFIVEEKEPGYSNEIFFFSSDFLLISF